MVEQSDNQKGLSSLPRGFRLLPEEELVSVITPTRRHSTQIPSSLDEILRLTRARSAEEIGNYGPSIAALALDSVALEEGKGTPEHLRLYEVLFGRDSLRVAIDLVSSYPKLARATVLELAQSQGVVYNREREEEPGRIVHEVRDKNSPIALRLSQELGWGWPYYGTVDATPEFIRTIAAYCRQTEEGFAFLSDKYIDKDGEERSLVCAMESALSWIERRLRQNKEGLLEYKSELPRGIENQVWKDSWDAYHHSDGTIANHRQGVASIEVQVTTYDALLDAADLFEDVLDSPERAVGLRAGADRLRKAILSLFWTEDKGGYFVIGTDRDDEGRLRQLKIRTSNMGHTLNSRLLEGTDPDTVHKREMVVRHMLSPEMRNVSGIRTLASDEYRFRPGAYHNGSVWLWDTHHIAKGMRRLGYVSEANSLDRGILGVVEATHLLPEYVRGDDSDKPSTNHQIITVLDKIHDRVHKIEQPPQEIQAWTAAAILATENRIKRATVALNDTH